MTKDFSEANDLAAKEPKKLRELQELFWIEAAKYNVLPLDNSKIERMDVANRPSLTRGPLVFTYYPGMTRIPEGSAPDIKNKSFKIAAEVEIPEGGAEGVLVTQGGRFNGWGLYLLAGKPVFHYNLVGKFRYNIAGKDKLAPGKHTIVSTSSMTAAASAKAAPPRSRWTAKRRPKARSSEPSRSASLRTRRWTSAKTPARRSARTTRCRSSSPAQLTQSGHPHIARHLHAGQT